jgi:hypothetical protein
MVLATVQRGSGVVRIPLVEVVEVVKPLGLGSGNTLDCSRVVSLVEAGC